MSKIMQTEGIDLGHLAYPFPGLSQRDERLPRTVTWRDVFCPSWRFGTVNGDQLGLGCSIEDALPGRSRRMLVGRDGPEPFLHQLLAGPGYRADADIQSRGDLAVAPSFARLGRVRVQQHACLCHLACAVFALVNQRVEPFALLISELHDMLLCGSLFRSQTQLRQCGAIDSGIDHNIKDVG